MPVYVQHEVLGKVSDVFNAETLWQAPGLALFSRRPLLRDLLERSPREHRGRAPTRCFSHITLMLAQDEVDDDRHLTRGARVRDLAQSLTALHQKDFGDLLGSDDVRYDVVGTDTLEPGQVEVKFGHAVYLPAAGEQPLYTVKTSRDSAIWQAVCPIYPQQRLALIGHDADLASHAVPAWPFGPVGAILLINDGPDAPIEVQVRPKGAFDCALDPLSGHYLVTAKGDSAGARLLMRVRRAAAASIPAPNAAASAKAAAVWKARAPAAADNGETAVPFSHRPAAAPVESDVTYAPLAQQKVSLVALALPCLSRYHETGAVSMEINLAPSLQLAADDETAAIGFAVDSADQLFAVTGAGRQPIEAPASFTPVDARAVELLAVAPAMADRYRAVLRLPHPIAAPVASGARFAFGRSAPMLAALRVLDSARFLRLAGGADSASADRIGLSRSAFSFEAEPGGYRIGRLSATQALYHLDDKLAFVACIGEASAEQPYMLPSGHHLVAGHYVLRFDA
ncbi:hypothetical protein IV454_21665 [Massilia antarctica]|uniref:Uncharacterized protein n=1 Tax=Massilia antarctica TaxID=2765360 RepID=A0AA49A725_9BURK|nr:hypothetical protein [Massilia antarctica]QPI48140.1 hypothetical protein IV454_21665 [Massilia antarctica]